MRVLIICAGFIVLCLLAVSIFEAPPEYVAPEAVAKPDVAKATTADKAVQVGSKDVVEAPAEKAHSGAKAHGVYGRGATAVKAVTVSPEHAKEEAHSAANVQPKAEAHTAAQKNHAGKKGRGHHWSYAGATGPAHWGGLDPKFSACLTGRNQSPINLSGFTESVLAPIEIDYHGQASEVINNGHAIQANFPVGDGITVDGTRFELKQIHLHAPSENQINGRLFAMEAHFVHADSEGNLAVIGVMFELGAENPLIAKIWQQMPKQAGGKAALQSAVSAADLLPADRDYYRFNGSLTTPPCSEGVTWLVMKQPLRVSPGQVDAFAALMGGPTNRPVQPLNSRVVLQ